MSPREELERIRAAVQAEVERHIRALADLRIAEARAEAKLKGEAVAPPGPSLSRVHDDNVRRGIGRARGAAKHELAIAIVNDPRWGTVSRYARERLGRSPATLGNYLSGVSPAPPDVVAAVRRDFPGVKRPFPRLTSQCASRY